MVDMIPVRIHFSLGDEDRSPAGGELLDILEAVRAAQSCPPPDN